MSRFRLRDYQHRWTLMRGAAVHVTVAAAALALLGTVAAASSAATPSRPVFKLDHHLCYLASAKGFRIPTRVVLKNQFTPNGFRVHVGAAVLHCNPVEKILPTGTVPITNPAAHLVCFRISAGVQHVPALVLVQNQFGAAGLTVGQPVLLCLPSWKRVARPPHTRTPQPPGLDHFTCYLVHVSHGAYRVPTGIKLKDQFARRPVSVRVGNVPRLLCLPTVKIVHGHVTRVINPTMHLLCFPVGTPTPIRPRVFDKNQFGTAVVRIHRSVLLCLPSTKQIPPPP